MSKRKSLLPQDPPAPPPSATADPETLAHNEMLFVQSIKGATASVLFALGYTRRPMSHEELMIWTHCGHTQVTIALHSLVEIGWVWERTARGPWILAEGRQLPVNLLPLPASALKAPSSSSTSSDNPFTRGQEQELSARRKHLIKSLYLLGIREPMASELADLPYVSAEFARRHVEQARAEGQPLGSAIHRIRNDWPMPPRHLSRREDVEATVRKFLHPD
jgi:hypothetical protein